jgi:hypothetical protein
VLPQPEDCATPFDEDCDGMAPACKGSLVWAKRFGGPSTQEAAGVAVDAAGNIVVTGYFLGAIDFGGGVLTSAGESDVFLVKLGADGAHLWSRRFGDASAKAVAVDADGNVFVTGDFSNAIDFGTGPLTNTGANDIFLAKLDPTGAPVWAKHFAMSGDPHATGVAVDAAGNVLVTGYYLGSVDFGGGPLTSTGGANAYIAKLDAGGAHLWSKQFASIGGGMAGGAVNSRGISVDASGGVLVTGSFSGSADFGGMTMTGAGTSDVYVAKLDAGGAPVWSKRFGSPGTVAEGRSIVVDASGNVVACGNFLGSVNIGAAALTNMGAQDVYIAKLSGDGTPLWSQQLSVGGASATATCGSVTVDAGGNVIVTGDFSGSVTFGGDMLPSAGGADVFLAKLDPTGVYAWSKRFGDGSDQRGIGVAADPTGHVAAVGNFFGSVNFGGGWLQSAGNEDVFVARFAP